MKKAIGAIVLAVSLASAHAQSNGKGKEPQLTEVEQLRLENISLKAAPVQQRLQELQKEYSDLVAQIEKEHPGYGWDPQKGKLIAKPSDSDSKTKK